MPQTLLGAILVVVGLGVVLRHRSLAKSAANFHHRVFGIREDLSERVNRIGYLLCGVGFALAGLLALAGVVRFRGTT
jgi:hypothetical protein